MNKINPSAVLLCSAIFLSLTAYSQVVKLVFNKGAKYETTSVTKSSTVSTMMGQDIESISENTMVQTIEIKNIKDTATDLVSTFTKIKVNTTVMGQEMNYDSDNKNNEGPLADVFGKMVGKAKNITINANGKLVSEDHSSDSLSEGMDMMMGSSLGSGIPMIQAGLVGRNISIGAMWPDSMVSNSGKLKISVVGSYTVKQIENNIATIDFTGTQNMSGSIEQMGQEMNMTSSGKFSNQIQLNLSTGLIMENTYKISSTGNVDAMGMSIPTSVSTTVSNKVKAL